MQFVQLTQEHCREIKASIIQNKREKCKDKVNNYISGNTTEHSLFLPVKSMHSDSKSLTIRLISPNKNPKYLGLQFTLAMALLELPCQHKHLKGQSCSNLESPSCALINAVHNNVSASL